MKVMPVRQKEAKDKQNKRKQKDNKEKNKRRGEERNLISFSTSRSVNEQRAIQLAEEEKMSFQILKALGSWLMTQLSEAGNSLCQAQLSSSKDANC